MDALPLPSGGSAITFETPTIVKHAIGGAYRSGIPSLDRSAILADLGSSVPELSFQYFADHILPPSHVDASSVKKLIAEKHIIGGRWSAFPFNPATIIGTEQAVFKRLENVVQAIVSCCDGGQRAGFQYVDNPDRVPYLERTNLTRPDAYFELDPIASTVRSGSSSESRLSAWYNIGVAGECKTANTDNNSLDDDVTAKVIWSMHHIMRSDPCRRFTLGFTIEDTTTRIWFCCRQIVLVTQPFNFITEHEKLIQFVSSVLYSGRVSMGWDPTIIRHVTDNRTYFDITVHSQGKAMQFRSSKFLSNLGAGAIRGRGTRVFRARRLNDEGKEVGEEVALRDVWVDVDRLREADIYQRLQTDVEALGPDSLKEFQRLFLTIVTHGDVLIDNVADRTLDLAMRNAEVSGSHVGKFHLWCKPLALSRPDVNSSGASPTLDAPNLTRAPVSHSRHVHPQVHYRVVFQEVGVAVFEVKSLDKFFHVLVDGAKALDLMHACGWVHRDISSGNILQVGDGGKLCDLEYAKKIDGEGGHAVRTVHSLSLLTYTVLIRLVR
ncbi:hypothetical protein JAAARDRAFT_54793 [Jaapia argillacea MUCL 33604]|uniref:Fungal-type protein kinase domain-containing protein n=1 Tax=Jaapia argillacea MUCL 33604 TaxID=933084 RepID=A0A067QD76_9AGAM|nr:hypothetical protein JAAARDRAFT_54793 [Jaapia argillacea MUCL 33604]